jgi:hypothetical protein
MVNPPCLQIRRPSNREAFEPAGLSDLSLIFNLNAYLFELGSKRKVASLTVAHFSHPA